MNFRIKQALLAAGIASTMALPMTSQASDGTINFTGAVTASTCTVSVNGGGTSGTVALPTVGVSSLPNTSGEPNGTDSTAGGTFFTMTISGCSAQNDFGGTKPTSVAIYFEAGPTVDEKTYGLINTAASGSNVEVNLYNASGSTVVGTQIHPGVQGSGSNQPTALTIAAGGESDFYAGYSTAALAAGTAASAGAVSTEVTYSLIYD